MTSGSECPHWMPSLQVGAHARTHARTHVCTFMLASAIIHIHAWPHTTLHTGVVKLKLEPTVARSCSHEESGGTSWTGQIGSCAQAAF